VGADNTVDHIELSEHGGTQHPAIARAAFKTGKAGGVRESAGKGPGKRTSEAQGAGRALSATYFGVGRGAGAADGNWLSRCAASGEPRSFAFSYQVRAIAMSGGASGRTADRSMSGS
jgi:hypothetical protein